MPPDACTSPVSRSVATSPLVQPLAGQQTAPGAANAFVATVAANGSALTFSTYLGGSEADEAHGIAVSPDGGLVVAGETRSTDFPVRNARQPIAQGLDGFVTKIAAGSHPVLVDVSRRAGQRQPVRRSPSIATGAIAVAGTSNSPDYPAAAAVAGRWRRLRRHRLALLADRRRCSSRRCSAALRTTPLRPWRWSRTGVVHVGGSTASPDFPATNTAGTVGTSLDAFAVTYASAGTRATAWRIGGSGSIVPAPSPSTPRGSTWPARPRRPTSRWFVRCRSAAPAAATPSSSCCGARRSSTRPTWAPAATMMRQGWRSTASAAWW